MKAKGLMVLAMFLLSGCATMPVKAQTVVVEKVYIEKPVIKERVIYKTKVVYKWRTKWRTKVVYRCPSPKYKKKVVYRYYH